MTTDATTIPPVTHSAPDHPVFRWCALEALPVGTDSNNKPLRQDVWWPCSDIVTARLALPAQFAGNLVGETLVEPCPSGLACLFRREALHAAPSRLGQ